MARNFSLIVFDWDGTLMDSEARIVDSLELTIAELGLHKRSRQSLGNIIGLGLRQAISTLYPSADAVLVQRFITCYRDHYLSVHHAPALLFPGALDTLEQLSSQGYLLAVATGKSRRGLERSLDETGCRNLFQITRCADESLSKPHPQMLLEIMDVLDVMPAQTLMIGDTEYDVMMARQAGSLSLGVDYGVHERERLMTHGALDCLGDIREVVPWLDEHSDISQVQGKQYE